MGEQFHFYPELYLELVLAEVPKYREMQRATAGAGIGLEVRRVLDLGVGTGETSAEVMRVFPDAELVGIDESEAMLTHARDRLPGADLRVGRLQDELPEGPSTWWRRPSPSTTSTGRGRPTCSAAWRRGSGRVGGS